MGITVEDTTAIFKLLDYSVPLFLLVAAVWASFRVAKSLNEQFVKPLGGPEGVIAKFFAKQSECLSSQTDCLENIKDLMRHHNDAADKMAVSLGALHTLHKDHNQSTNEWQAKANVELRDLLYCHGKLAHMVSLLLQDNPDAREAAEDIDSVIRKYLIG